MNAGGHARRCAGAVALLAFVVATTAGAADTTLYGRLDASIVKQSGAGWSVTQASTSRWGLRGGEDLGSGMELRFQLESGLDSDTGRAQSGFRRESWVGIRGGFGSARIGRSQSPSQRVASNYDPFGTDGIGSFGSGDLLIGHSDLVRLDNAVWYETPRLGGASLFAAYSLDEDTGARADIWSLRLRIERGPIDAALAVADAGPAGNSLLSLGAACKLGASKLMLQWHTGKRDGDRWRSGLVGAVVPLASTQLLLAASRIEQRSGGASWRTRFAAGIEQPLSARTVLFGTLARSSDRPGEGDQRTQVDGVELGMRHNF